MSDDFDFRAIVRYLTPTNVLKWLLVVFLTALAFIAIIWIAVQAWSSS